MAGAGSVTPIHGLAVTGIVLLVCLVGVTFTMALVTFVENAGNEALDTIQGAYRAVRLASTTNIGFRDSVRPEEFFRAPTARRSYKLLNYTGKVDDSGPYAARKLSFKIDGVEVNDGDRILLAQQDNPTENGIYVKQADELFRASDMERSNQFSSGLNVFIAEGQTLARSYVGTVALTSQDNTARVAPDPVSGFGIKFFNLNQIQLGAEDAKEGYVPTYDSNQPTRITWRQAGGGFDPNDFTERGFTNPTDLMFFYNNAETEGFKIQFQNLEAQWQINTAANTSGLTGGGDLTTPRDLSVDIVGTTATLTAEDDDLIMIYDTSDAALKSITRANLLGGTDPNEFSDALFRVFNTVDNTKKLAFDCVDIATGTTRTATWPNADTWIPGITQTQAGYVEAMDQSVATTDNVSFSQVTVGNTGLIVGTSTPFNDAAGTLTFQNVDAVDATTVTTFEAALTIDQINGWVANENIDHSTVSIATAAGTSGLTGGGDITATRNLSVDVPGTTLETTAENADLILMYDDSAGALRSISLGNVISGVSPSTFSDAEFRVFNAVDNTKLLAFDCVDIATGTTRTATWPNTDTWIPGITQTQAGYVEAMNQSLATTDNVSFSQVTVGNTGLIVGASTPFSDAAGTLTFQNVDAVDATTVSTFEAALTIDQINGWVANENINHSTVSIATAAGTSGLTGGGDITATRNLSVDISGTTLETTAENADLILMYDDSAAGLRSISLGNVISGVSPTTFSDAEFRVFNAVDNTKLLAFDCVDIATGTTRTATWPNADTWVPGITQTQAGYVEALDQSVATTDNVSFSQVTVGNTGLIVGTSTPFSDAAGTLTFQNVDAVDATTVTTFEAALTIDQINGWVANENIDHSTVNIATAAGTSGLTGGGDITATRNLSVDVPGTTLETTANNADLILMYDDSAAALRSISLGNVISGVSPTTFSDAEFRVFNSVDNTKLLAFDCVDIATGTTRTATWPNADTWIPGITQTQAGYVEAMDQSVATTDTVEFGRLGLGTSTVPHGGVGAAKFAIEGVNAEVADGPHIQITTDADDYPLFQMLNFRHDNINMAFDAFYNGVWTSSDAGSNFYITKFDDRFEIRYDSGVAAGAAITWNNGIALLTSGFVGIGLNNPAYQLHVHENSTASAYISVTNSSTGTSSSDGVQLGIDSAHSFLISRENTQMDFYTNNSLYMTLTNTGKLGLGTTTVPHGGIGAAKFAIDGTANSTSGPHMQFTTTEDSYPTIQILNWRHGDVHIMFDSYYDGLYRSSDTDGNFALVKSNANFVLRYDSGLGLGSVISWNVGTQWDTSGNMNVPNGGVNVGWTGTSTNQIHIKSATDASIKIEADTDNSGEDDNPYLEMSQDGGLVISKLGINGTTNFTYTGCNDNSAYFVSEYTVASETSGNVQFGTAGTIRMTINQSGKVGLGTTTIPHNSIGWAKFALDGTANSSDGPHMQITTSADDYPVFQVFVGNHDDQGLIYDAYYDGSWRSSDSGSNFAIKKSSDTLEFRYDSGVAQGAVVTWNNAMVIDTSGDVTFGNDVTVTNDIAAANFWGPFPSSVTYATASGSSSVVFPVGTKACIVELQAGGGGGGGEGFSTDAGGGGGGGSFVTIWFTATDLSGETGFDYVVGAGGAGGTGNNNGVDGGNSTVSFTVGPTLIATAFGGQGGNSGSVYGVPGLGGDIATVVGGYTSQPAYGETGSQGHDAGTVVTNYTGGSGGNSRYGRGGHGGFDQAGGAAIDGTLGAGGGGGAIDSFTHTGADGGDGFIRILWFS